MNNDSLNNDIDNKKKLSKIVHILPVLLLVFVAIVGISFAFYQVVFSGSRENTISTPDIVFVYNEPSSALSVEGDSLSDSDGISMTDYFEFSVSATTSSIMDLGYNIYLTENTDNTISNSNVKVYLTKVSGSTETALLNPDYVSNLYDYSNASNSKVLYSGVFNFTTNTKTTKTDTYRLRAWIGEVKANITDQGDNGQNITVGGSYKFKVSVDTLAYTSNSLKSISVTTAPSKTSYILGESFDKSGMVVTATYENGKTSTITNYTITNGSSLAANQSSVTISYTEAGVIKTCTQSVSVATSFTNAAINGSSSATHAFATNYTQTGAKISVPEKYQKATSVTFNLLMAVSSSVGSNDGDVFYSIYYTNGSGTTVLAKEASTSGLGTVVSGSQTISVTGGIKEIWLQTANKATSVSYTISSASLTSVKLTGNY